MGTEKDRKDTQQAILYELRRLIKKSGKDYTNEELCNLIDTIAEAGSGNLKIRKARAFARALKRYTRLHSRAAPTTPASLPREAFSMRTW